ncbi:bifunctional adenosylcobinamide kinase/adenosylcobinamide-phosphate guanylyltransferase [Anaerotignum lactatifermentans]|uniref:Adenosylcobinamide kinase n=1 Tax=Anaerotignum lactatifermentans TaxID=160404 RepID=A0ABS2GAR8_9FIRM|nr:bifunctional adenosylcobinamide kinase/adenosylcobinamide-phosphate guanylyltransferase [Anaerotignum lactatifermentans]MBM6829805.1 bifunctional adenosylcobinamide kinase/adenosylcobinamide-phosphate guanylyltransferase [Anaerotignum lactatifermentans]MBM6878255.1 bifunctional adenosylcobinamide kinase/adenosylcobinamide-phosphate guanylyltransferase [Anaerotignum lactatifermentans]MBM6951335.1 bifunctional adenosylcobinamide kinase/adenosylcobinamide-phosphate guanylyltransferase [Anaerotig
MMILVSGRAASGKSAYAEELILKYGKGRRIYIATMEPLDQESEKRIERHRAMRRGKGFQTIERYYDLAGLTVPEDSAVLLECLGNLAANERYGPQGAGEDAFAALLDGVEHLRRQCGLLVVVANDIFSGGRQYEGDTLGYLRMLALLHRRLAERADAVCEVVCGIPCYYKGGERL